VRYHGERDDHGQVWIVTTAGRPPAGDLAIVSAMQHPRGVHSGSSRPPNPRQATTVLPPQPSGTAYLFRPPLAASSSWTLALVGHLHDRTGAVARDPASDL